MFALVIPFSLIGCKKSSSDPIIGTWRMVSDQEIRISTGEVTSERTFGEDDGQKIIFKKDNTFVAIGYEDKFECTWKKDGDNYIVTMKRLSNDQIYTDTYNIKDEKLITEEIDGDYKYITTYVKIK